MKDMDLVYDWVDIASLFGGAALLTLLVYSVIQL